MQLTIDLAKASLKDAEHAIFVIAAYFGITELPQGFRVGMLRQEVPPLPVTRTAVGGVNIGGASAAIHPQALGASPSAAEDAAATFGGHPGTLPPEAQTPAQVFAGNGATGPAGGPVIPGAALSVLPAAAAAVGDAGNANAATATVAAGSTPTLNTGLAPVAPPAPIAAGPVGTPAAPAPAPAASAAPGVETDLDGLPWDPRIHASSEGGAKPKNADGRWRKKRGLNDAELVARVQAELRATMAAGKSPTPPAASLPPPPPASGLPVPPQPQAPVAPAGPPTTFEQLMPRLTPAINSGALPQGALLAAVTAYQLPNIIALAQRPDVVPAVWAYLQSVYPGVLQ